MRVVVPYDGSELSERAVDHALERYDDAEVVVLHVLDFVESGYESPPDAELLADWSEWHERAEDRAEERFRELRNRVGRDIETETVVGRPTDAILEYVDDSGADAVVMGSHGREGLSRILLGSVAETVVRRSPVPVTVVR